MSTLMTSERFSILKNGIDERLEIIRDNETGFYNITKTAKMIAKLLETEDNLENNESNNERKSENKEPARFRAGSNKLERTRKWFENDTTQALIDEVIKQTGLNKVYYELAKGTPKRFAGTYIHKLLFDHFLAWLDPRYAIKISIILDSIHQDANRKLLQEKDDKIDMLIQETKAQTNKIDNLTDINQKQSAEIQKLLSYAQNTTHELSEARLDIQDNTTQIELLNDKVEECRDVIIDRMDEHTLNPVSITKRQYFTCLQHPKYENILYVIRSQKSNIKKQLKAHSDWDVLIEPIEDPNSIKMFNRFKDRVKMIESSWKTEIKLQFKTKEIDRETRDSKLQFIVDNPLVTITRNNIEFDTDRITTKQIIQLMQDTTFDARYYI